MESWYFDQEEDKLNVVVDGSKRGEVKGIDAAKKVGFVRVVMTTMEVLKLCVESFNYIGSSICRSMPVPSSPGSRTVFVKRWRKYLKADSSTSSNSSSDSNDSETPLILSTKSDGMTDKTTTLAGVQDQVVNDHFLGTYDVHVSNLCPPAPSRATRVVDHDHVGVLTESYQEQACGQLVILVGMITEDVEPVCLAELNHSCKVEILGGNHTREALQSLQRKGVLMCPTVKVNLYKNLPRTAALAIGYQHNMVLHEKKKQMSFLDKVRLMRDCRQDETVSWKDMLVMVFREKDRRSLQHRFNIHLLMASLPDDIWSKVVRYGDVNEKFYRQLMRLDDDQLINCCLDTLLTKGTLPFKNRVKQFIDEGHVRSKKKVKQVSHGSASNDTQEEPEDIHGDLNEPEDTVVDLKQELDAVRDDYSTLQEKYNSLQEENDLLKKQIESLNGDKRKQEKRRRDILDETFKVDDQVEAFWRFDTGEEQWLTANVVTVYADGKMIKVKYLGDNSTAKVPKSWVRGF